MILRAQLACEIGAARRILLPEKNEIDPAVRIEQKGKLESIYKRFIAFKNSGSAWQDIHGADSEMLSTASGLLDRL
jgi:hypothetical protein